MPTDENEHRFKQFSNMLLAAEERGYRADVAFYSADALRRILKEFCNIIADDLQVQSCTVQLKLHDLASCSCLHELTLNKEVQPPANLPADLCQFWNGFKQEFQDRWQYAGGQIRRPQSA